MHKSYARSQIFNRIIDIQYKNNYGLSYELIELQLILVSQLFLSGLYISDIQTASLLQITKCDL